MASSAGFYLTMNIRPADEQDLPAILGIQGRCPASAQWLAADYERLANDPDSLILLAGPPMTTSIRVLGFAAFRRLMDEAELMNLAVDPEHRRRGIGRALLEDARNRLMQAGVNRLFLEVRPSNKPALALYGSLGFVLYSRRKDYYTDPLEDAYVMCLQISVSWAVPSAR